MKLYIIHCGFYDPAISAGLYESHTNLLIAATSFEEAREKVRRRPEFKKYKMHVDGLQEVVAVQGFALSLDERSQLNGKTITHNLKFGSRTPRLVES